MQQFLKYGNAIMLSASLLLPNMLHAQDYNKRTGKPEQDVRWVKHQVVTLTSASMAGRGYVHHGVEKAGSYIANQFRELGLLPYPIDSSSYYQTYYFPVNTFPDKMEVTIGKKPLEPGADYIVDAASPSFFTQKMKIRKVDLDDFVDSTAWANEVKSWNTTERIYFLKNADSLCKRLSLREWQFAKSLPKGCYIIPKHGKLTWTVSTDTIAATIIYAEDTALPKKKRYAAINIHAKYLPENKNRNENVIACIPGEIKDSFVVFSAHYDHLGMMGEHTRFPGASDNASGTAMLLYLAAHYVPKRPHYTMIFIAFSGEEAGLLGSHYFVKNPTFPLDHIRFLTNLDIMGDASDGVTVVNATEYPKEFSLLQEINDKRNYIPAIKSRGKAANSDHYYFTQAGVPSFFIYSNGGKGFYHDIFDNAKELSYSHIDGVIKLLIDFTDRLK
jgi:hypothetical protein